MTVDAIWRYPVKSMAGERLEATAVGTDGVSGDRVVQVYDRRGRLVTARTFPQLLGLHGTLGSNGEPLVDGFRWDSREAADRVQAAVGPGASLHRVEALERFDVLPLLVCTDSGVRMFGRDLRRLRPNLLIDGVEDGAERTWPRAALRLPDAEIRVEDLRARCVMTTYDPDTVEQTSDVLREIVRRFDGQLGLNARVVRDGCVRVGDPVTIDAVVVR
jgi:hypothetical protein